MTRQNYFITALHEALAHHAEAESRFTLSLEILQRRLNPSHPEVSKSLTNLAELYRKSGREIETAEMEKRASVKQDSVSSEERIAGRKGGLQL